jgi:hypothetical protein
VTEASIVFSSSSIFLQTLFALSSVHTMPCHAMKFSNCCNIFAKLEIAFDNEKKGKKHTYIQIRITNQKTQIKMASSRLQRNSIPQKSDLRMEEFPHYCVSQQQFCCNMKPQNRNHSNHDDKLRKLAATQLSLYKGRRRASIKADPQSRS